MNVDERRKRLISWLNDIQKEIRQIHIHQEVFWAIQEILNDNPDLRRAATIFNDCMAQGFISSAATSIRRQADDDRNSVSLYRVLDELNKYPQLLAREHVLRAFSSRITPVQATNDLANDAYDRYIGRDLDVPDRARIQAEMDQLKSSTLSIKGYVDRRIAHYDRRCPKHNPNFEQVDRSIELLEKMIGKYRTLLTGGTVVNCSIAKEIDWSRIFCLDSRATQNNAAGADPMSGHDRRSTIRPRRSRARR